jgi:serine phosphatase RsbU (regulator of sigma subunit)
MLLDVAADLQVTHFTTLAAALEAWPADAECVLLDLGLPDAVGLSALEKLRLHVPDVPVVVLTGRVDDASGPAALAAGAQDFLVKGQVDAAGLERSLRYAVERGRATTYERELVAAQVRAEENSRLQRGLLPNPLIASDDIEVAFFYRPGRERALLGGDFYDVVETGEGIHLLIGDVSGHGPDEAALGVALRITWRALVLAGLKPADVLLGVEQVLLAERGNDDQFATVAMATLAPDLASAQVWLAGHPAPLLLQGFDVQELDVEPAPPLAVAPGTRAVSATIPLPREWGLMLFTDGLVEGSASPGVVDRLGSGALSGHVQRQLEQAVPRQAMAPDLLLEAERHHGGPLPDDVAVMMVGTRSWWR